MRQIKFRAYYHRWTEDVWIIEGECTLKYLTGRGIQFDQERIEWVQYTGLKDKNGKEIFEGDILESRYKDYLTNKPIANRRTVSWDGIGWEPFVGNMDDAGDSYKYEIIGNIYKNPELIEAK
jgi:uncharacterized phage protein (TIGR01671 family)